MYWLDPNLRYATREADVMVRMLLPYAFLFSLVQMSHSYLNSLSCFIIAVIIECFLFLFQHLNIFPLAGICCELYSDNMGADPEPL